MRNIQLFITKTKCLVMRIWYSTKKMTNVHFVRGGLKKNYVVNRKKKSKLKSGERQKNLGMIDFEPDFFIFLSFCEDSLSLYLKTT